jgi:branched-chain amino acid transport system permease protein
MGYTMVYGIIELINFAHGDVFMLGLVISMSYFSLLGMAHTLHGWQLVTVLPFVFLATMLTTAAINVTIDRLAYRPLRRSTRLAPLITAIGVSFMLENIALVWKGPAPFSYPDIFPSVDILYDWLGWNSKIFLTTKDLLVFGATIPLMLGLQYFVTRTTWGKAMRAKGVHGRRARGHRQHAWRGARRTAHRVPVRMERPVHLGALDERGGLHDPHPGPRIPPARAARRPDAGQGVSEVA